ncbi:MAG: hypothetical protein WC694_00410 [Candidatus Paceibacterota bacterium]|jgi:hypothetical protein
MKHIKKIVFILTCVFSFLIIFGGTLTAQAYSCTGTSTITCTFSFTGSLENWTVPAGVNSISVTAKGAGGGGGGSDNSGNQTVGINGDLATTTVSVTPLETLTIIVAGGGIKGVNDGSGSAGGAGYTNGGTGGNGEYYGYCGDSDADEWAYGGAGAGGSSGIKRNTTRLVEAKGGDGGKSSDYGGACAYNNGGSGGIGGGSNYPALTTQYGGGTGGAFDTDGGNGSLILTYTGAPSSSIFSFYAGSSGFRIFSPFRIFY